MKTNKPLTPKLIYGIMILLLIGATYFLLRPGKVSVETARVERGNFVQVLKVDGTVKSKNKTTITARATGDLERVNLDVGDTVNKNQPLVVLKWDYQETIKSPITGVVSKVYRESAGPINRGDPIVDIIDPLNLEIEAEVLTNDAMKVPLGSSVRITGSGTDTVLQGHVDRISRAGFTKVSALGIEEEKTIVYVAIDKSEVNLGDNFHVELEITLSEDKNVLIVPLGSLFKNHQQWAVYTVEKQKTYLKNVEISKRNETQALVASGLREGETVVLFPGDQISEGTSIKTNKTEP